jgi:hypothetical protein
MLMLIMLYIYIMYVRVVCVPRRHATPLHSTTPQRKIKMDRHYFHFQILGSNYKFGIQRLKEFTIMMFEHESVVEKKNKIKKK